MSNISNPDAIAHPNHPYYSSSHSSSSSSATVPSPYNYSSMPATLTSGAAGQAWTDPTFDGISGNTAPGPGYFPGNDDYRGVANLLSKPKPIISAPSSYRSLSWYHQSQPDVLLTGTQLGEVKVCIISWYRSLFFFFIDWILLFFFSYFFLFFLIFSYPFHLTINHIFYLFFPRYGIFEYHLILLYFLNMVPQRQEELIMLTQ